MSPSPDPTKPSPGAVEHTLDFALPQPAAVSSRRLAVVGALVGAGLLAAFAVGYLPRRAAQAALVHATAASQDAAERIEVVEPKVGASDRALVLPGSVQPLQETVLYARASGYVRKWYADLGDTVKAGQVLADIETPELQQQLLQGRAQLAQAQASAVQQEAQAHLAQVNLARFKRLAPSGVVSQADLDQSQAQAEVAQANVQVAQANIAAQRANIRRLEQLQAFGKVTAPFAGTITQRTVEVGQLVTAGTGQPLFKLAAMDPARVFIQVPQDAAPGVKVGVAAQVKVREYPSRVFAGAVSRSAGALDPATRTMTTEVRVPNPDGALMAGMYAEASITLPVSHQVLELPATALMNDAHGQRVAVVDEHGTLHLVTVSVERDNGPTIEISSGLRESDRVAKIGSANFVDGMHVEVASKARPVGS